MSNAAAILAAAKDLVNAGLGRDVMFGEAKVMICHLAAVFADQIGEADFHAILVEEWKRGTLRLVRVDLVEDYDPALVLASEVTRGIARVHQVRVTL